jgi:hypothetical protein
MYKLNYPYSIKKPSKHYELFSDIRNSSTEYKEYEGWSKNTKNFCLGKKLLLRGLFQNQPPIGW